MQPRHLCSSHQLLRARRWAGLLAAIVALVALFGAGPGQPALAAGPLTYYVDCAAGSDGASGTSATQAWKTIGRANNASLQPGDALLLKRGCSWVGPLKARWHGTASQPIRIGAYGSGSRPKIQNSVGQNVDITGTYQVVEQLEAFSQLTTVDPGCNNQPVGWVIGFNLRGDAAYNIVRDVRASGHTAGVRISRTAHHNKVLSSELVNNRVMQRLDSSNPNNDLGAWGLILNGTDNEIAYNQLSGNNAICSYDFSSVGNAIELYEAQRNTIHHNRSIDDRVFSELGGSATRKSADNTFAYNVQISSIRTARFLVLKGSGSGFGPAWRTKAYNNTVFLTDAGSQGVVCSAGCTPDILSLRNNIIWAEKKAVYADGPFDEGNNIYWNRAGAPLVQLNNFAISSSSRKANPLFVNAGARDLHLQAASPAVNAGSSVSVQAGYTLDLDRVAVPQAAAADIGAYEYKAP